LEEKPPLFSERAKANTTKVVLLYSLFFVIMKIVAGFQGYDWGLNLLIALPFFIILMLGYWLYNAHKINWTFLLISMLAMAAIHYFEADFVAYYTQVNS
jgi:uncharacterized membrane protein